MIFSDNNDKDVRYHKPTFEKITQEKQERILNTAIEEFSGNGYNATSINVIAKKAGISIGSMYSYFDSKENLFMAILDIGYHYLEEALDEVVKMNGDLFDRIRRMVIISIEYSKKYQQINQIYIDVATEGLSHMSNKISLKMESLTARFYHDFLSQAVESGEIRSDLDIQAVSFCMDNLVMMTQFSFASAYYNERMKIYAGIENVENTEKLADGIVNFIRKGLCGK